jgi:hypothetical protein
MQSSQDSIYPSLSSEQDSIYPSLSSEQASIYPAQPEPVSIYPPQPEPVSIYPPQPEPVSIYPAPTDPFSIHQTQSGIASEKSWGLTMVLSILFGAFGIDRIYSGSYLLGLVKFFTGGGVYLWWIVDIILLATGNYKDGKGHVITRH